jgi:hypothetical protein
LKTARHASKAREIEQKKLRRVGSVVRTWGAAMLRPHTHLMRRSRRDVLFIFGGRPSAVG